MKQTKIFFVFLLVIHCSLAQLFGDFDLNAEHKKWVDTYVKCHTWSEDNPCYQKAVEYHRNGGWFGNYFPTTPPAPIAFQPTTAPPPPRIVPTIDVRTPAKVRDSCGQSAIPLIRGGSEVLPGEYPWMGALFRFGNDGVSRFQCTVNLISTKHVLTAAHCVFGNPDPKLYTVILGPVTKQIGNNIKLINIDVHQHYRENLASHDVAILTLSAAVTLSVNTNSICLWGASIQERPTRGIVAGFGSNYTKLHKIEIPIVTQDTCRASHRYFNLATTEFTFCAGNRDNRGPCRGDSGGGYMQWINGHAYLRGIVSTSIPINNDCNLMEYVLFADLTMEINWINEKIK